MAIIMTVWASISFADNQVRKKDIKQTQDYLARQMEIWEGSKMKFRYQARGLRNQTLEKENKEIVGLMESAAEELLIQKMLRQNARDEVLKLSYHILLIEGICEEEGLEYTQFFYIGDDDDRE